MDYTNWTVYFLLYAVGQIYNNDNVPSITIYLKHWEIKKWLAVVNLNNMNSLAIQDFNTKRFLTLNCHVLKLIKSIYLKQVIIHN